MATAAEIREQLREELAVCRLEVEANLVEATTTFAPAAVARSVELNAHMMSLLLRFVDAGGIVLAVPLYRANCTGPGLVVRARKRCIHHLLSFKRYYPSDSLPPFIAEVPRVPGTGIFYQVHAVKQKDGAIKHLERLVGAPGEPGEDPHVWKWMFADLREDENLDTLVREKARWGWAGKFTVGVELERGEGFGAPFDPADPDRVFTLV